MTKKHDMTDPEYESYDRIHNFDHPLDEEEGKVRRERSNAARYRRRARGRLKRRLRQITHPDDVDEWDDDPLLDDYEQRAERELRNAQAHKQRLRGLEDRDAQA